MTSQQLLHGSPTVWVPRELVDGHGGTLTKVQRLIYVALADRASNSTREVRATFASLARRVGVKDTRTIRTAIENLETAGLLTRAGSAPRGESGALRLKPVKSNGRLEVPLALLWSARTGGPRAGDQAPAATAALLALLHVSDFQTGIGHAKQATMGAWTGGSRRQFFRDLEVLRDSLPAGVLHEWYTRPDGKWGAKKYLLRLEHLPMYGDEPLGEPDSDGAAPGEVLALPLDSADVPDGTVTAQTVVDDFVAYAVDTLNLPAGRVERQRADYAHDVQQLIADGYSAAQVHDVLWFVQFDDYWSAQLRGSTRVVVDKLETIVSSPEFQTFAMEHGNARWSFNLDLAARQQRKRAQVAQRGRPYPSRVPAAETYAAGGTR